MYGSTYRFESVAERFGDLLRRSLIKSYGRLPSSGFVAREFNLRCEKMPPVTDETARRWIRGSTLPDASRLEVFASWLEIDFNAVFSDQRGLKAGCAGVPGLAAVDTTAPTLAVEPIIQEIFRLTPQQKAALYEFVKFFPAQAPGLMQQCPGRQ